MQVFDEFGEQVSPDIIEPGEISGAAVTWEEFQADIDARDALVQERTKLLEFQEKLDAARTEITDGEISIEDLDALEADLADTIPPAVAVHVEGFEMPEPNLGHVVGSGIIRSAPRSTSNPDYS